MYACCDRPEPYYSNSFDAYVCLNCVSELNMNREEQNDKKEISTGDFVHLRTYSHYSLLYALSKRKDLINKAKAYGMPAIAITERDNLFRWPDFYKQATTAGLKPIIGIDISIEPYFDHEANKEYRIILLASGPVGFKNLMDLTTWAWRYNLKKFKNKKPVPTITLEKLQKYSEGLFCISGYEEGIPGALAMESKAEIAVIAMNQLRAIFGDKFYLELQCHDTFGAACPYEEPLNGWILEISKTHNIPCVVTNGVRYTNPSDHMAHRALLAIGNPGHEITQTLGTPCEDWYFKSSEDMRRMGFDSSLIPSEAYDNTLKLADRIEDYGLTFKKGYFEVPLFRDSTGRAWTSDESHKKLEEMSWNGLLKKGKFSDPVYRDRLIRELEVLKDKNYSSYFLIISDIIKYMEAKGILKPVGRGSSVGSLVCYATEITTPDPIRWKVPFERFINDGRQDLPDIDTDISKESRHEVLNYIRDTYGENRVAQIATFQTLAAKAALDNVGRVLGVPQSIRHELSKIMGDVTGSKLIDPEDGEELCKPGSEARILIDQTDNWWEIACALEDTPKNVGYHAAGVVISNDDIDKYTCLMADHEGYRAVQIDMIDIETLGLLKLDMLGLRTLDVIDQSIKLVKQYHNVDIDIYTMENNPSDKNTYELISQGNYVSIFQVDSPGYRRLLKDLQPESFEHMMATVALYRPGPMGAGTTKSYIKRRHGQEPLDIWHPELEDVFSLSYNLCLYQEQVMALAKILSGFTDVEADKLRKGIGKKKREVVDEALDLLIIKGVENGRNDKEMKRIAKLLREQARYTWNLGHSAGYGYITYITAYLEANYPIEYYASLLNCNADKAKEKDRLMANIVRRGVRIGPPHINKSSLLFEPDTANNTIHVGLLGIKGVRSASQKIIEEREENGPFTSFIDFCKRCPSVNKNAKKALVRSGAFTWDETIVDRDKIENIDNIMKLARKRTKKIDGSKIPDPLYLMECHLTNSEFSDLERQELEKEAVGFYVTGHPTAIFQRISPLLQTGDTPVITPINLQEYVGHKVYMISMVGMVIRKMTNPDPEKYKETDPEKYRRMKNKPIEPKPYLVLGLSDQFTQIYARVWSPLCDEIAYKIRSGMVCAVYGEIVVDSWTNDLTIKVHDVHPLSDGIPVNGFIGKGSKITLATIDRMKEFNIKANDPCRASGDMHLVSLKRQVKLTPEIIEDLAKNEGVQFTVAW